MTTTLRAECFVPGNHLMAGLLGTRDEHLRRIEQAFPDDQIVVQGDRISVEGPDAETVVRLFEELILMAQSGKNLDSSTVARAIDMVREDIRPSDVLRSEVVRAAGGKTVRPNTAGQKRYVDAISQNIITFGIGPAGTGKSYLAVAQAVHALQSRQVSRIILTRPAVEAGERLGFLPGDLMAKVDPYLRPSTTPSTTCSSPRAPSDCWIAGPLRWRRSPSCAAGRSTVRSSSSMRLRTPLPSR